MSTWETTEYKIAECPCGTGHVVRQTSTPDNPWSRSHASYRVQCERCSKEWAPSRGLLTHIGDQREYDDFWRATLNAADAIDTLMEPEVEAYFSDPRLKSMSQERREMEKLHLGPRDIRLYRQGRNANMKYSKLCHPYRNPAWLMALAGKAGKVAELTELIVEYDEAQRAHGAKQVRRITFRDDSH
ncbi:hypothetical protein [Rhizobium leguminosarum]|uniref:hypothetical protein n=1 Tax=Rhizobium leguminosarum TaxID=384 RepID=UPI001C9699A0|nr:hypothetical protein [Rhizobium leguminosarum]MBY5610902.1 hypothetical protein [Rhizobium leguminosarum]